MNMFKKRSRVNICGRSDGRLAAAMVHCSLFMVRCLFLFYSVYLDLRVRVVRTRVRTSTFSCVFMQIKQDHEILRPNP